MAAALTGGWLGCVILWHLGASAEASILDSVGALYWCSPLLTLPAALFAARWSRRRGLTWFLQNRWNFAGFLTAIALIVAFLVAVIAAAISLASGAVGVYMWPVAGVFLVSLYTALPVWFMAAGLIVGPGSAGGTAGEPVLSR